MVPVNIKVICIAMDIICLLICFLLRIDFGFKMMEARGFDKKLFNKVLFYSSALLVTDALSWVLIGVKSFYLLHYLVLSVHYSLNILILAMWIAYCDYTIYEDRKRTKRLKKFFLIPIIIVTALSFSSIKTGFFFTITKDNVYYRGDYYLLFVIFNVSLLLYSIVFLLKHAIRNKNENNNSKIYILIIFPILPVIGIAIQTLFFGVNVTWLLTTVSLIMVYFHFQNNQLIIDPLTKISNRYRFDNYFERNFNKKVGNCLKFIAIADLDNFKNINDICGHLEGDIVLKMVAKIIKKNVDPKFVVARIGGDEFAIFGAVKKESEIEKIFQNINSDIKKYNDQSRKIYQISLSIGYSIQDPEHSKSKKAMFTEADRKMYEEKSSKYQRCVDCKFI